jgi:hypothetical protein
MKVRIALLLALAAPAAIFAQELSQEQVGRLKPIQEEIRVIDRLLEKGVLTPEHAVQARELELKEAGGIAGQSIADAEALDHLVAKYDQTRYSGVFTFANIVWFFAAVLLTLAVVVLGVLYLRPLFAELPLVFWELTAYAFALLGLASGWLWPVLGTWFVIPGCLLLIPALGLTRQLHFTKKPVEGAEDVEALEPGQGGVAFNFGQFAALCCTVVWGAAALYYQSHAAGFLAVMALEAFLGFSAFVVPGLVAIGFHREDVVPRATAVSFLILAAYVVLTITGTLAGPMQVFQEGALFMGAFVFYLGMLIMASRMYNASRGNYALMQAATIVSGIAAFFFGAAFNIHTLLGIGGTFFVLYLLEKYSELPWKTVGWAWGLLGLAGILYGAAWLAGRFPQYFLIGLRGG